MTSLLDVYNNTYSYYPFDKNEIVYFQSEKGNMIRTGLCVYSLQKRGRFVNYRSRVTHLSLQDNYAFKIIKRGMPKLYEFNINQKYKKQICITFNDMLMKKLEKLYETFKIPRINIKKIKIKSQIYFQISYDKENYGWIVSDNLNNCVIFRDINEVNSLYRDKRINKFMYRICKECDELFKNILKKKESSNRKVNHNFLYEISKNTFLGFYLPEKDEIVFYSIVSNLQYNLEQFCLPLKEVEDICFKFGLPYEKSITLKTDLVTFQQISQELKYIYRRISEDYASFQSFGAIVLIEHDNEILTGFKILNQEMKIIKKMKMIKFNLNYKKNNKKINISVKDIIKEEEENSNLILNSNKSKENNEIISNDKLNEFMHEYNHYQLPRCVHAYTKLFNDLQEDDMINKCLENLEEISKNIYEICNCQKEKSTINIGTINLLSCLIPIDHLNYNSEQNTPNEINVSSKNINDISIRCQTFNFNAKPKGKKVYIGYNKNPTLKLSSYLFDQKPIIFNKKKPKKKVKFVDEVYNKSLVEEIQIKSFKGYNMRNNYMMSERYTNCKVCRKTACCLII